MLLRRDFIRALAFLVFALLILALALVGDTGLVGLIIGIAFRDITENFLASICLSMQPPFETGELANTADDSGVGTRPLRATGVNLNTAIE